MICHVVYSFAVIVAQVSVDSFFYQAQVLKIYQPFRPNLYFLRCAKDFSKTHKLSEIGKVLALRESEDTYKWFLERFGDSSSSISSSLKLSRLHTYIHLDFKWIWRLFQLKVAVKIAVLNKQKIRVDKSEGSPEMWRDFFSFQYSELHLSLSPF